MLRSEILKSLTIASNLLCLATFSYRFYLIFDTGTTGVLNRTSVSTLSSTSAPYFSINFGLFNTSYRSSSRFIRPFSSHK